MISIHGIQPLLKFTSAIIQNQFSNEIKAVFSIDTDKKTKNKLLFQK